MLIEHLPPESATKTALRNAIPAEALERVGEGRPDLAPWSGTETLLASVKDEVRLLRMVMVAANGGKPGEFTPTPRPGIPPKSAQSKREGLSDEQRRALDPRLRNQPKEA
ncbi:hypothetical protein [Streptomyces canus]|uniref:hypothetical protein n=1 Tax=Streptomyces canus TaxID=58343 RepID=UPI00386D2B31|nr:hypothetical protein OH824_34740 [Streptomyces canus]